MNPFLDDLRKLRDLIKTEPVCFEREAPKCLPLTQKNRMTLKEKGTFVRLQIKASVRSLQVISHQNTENPGRAVAEALFHPMQKCDIKEIHSAINMPDKRDYH